MLNSFIIILEYMKGEFKMSNVLEVQNIEKYYGNNSNLTKAEKGIKLFFLFYAFFTRRDFPVISSGCSIPISSIRVGTISARRPPSLSV